MTDGPHARTHPRPHPWVVGLLTLATVATACATGSVGVSPSASADASPAASAAASATATPIAGMPVELVGEWHTDLTQYLDPDPLCPNCGAETELTIHAHGRYTIGGYGPFRPSGSFILGDDGLITFNRSTAAGQGDCPAATYSWHLNGDELTFAVVEHDGCGRRADALDGVTYTRAD